MPGDDQSICTSSKRTFDCHDGEVIRQLFPLMVTGEETIRKKIVREIVESKRPDLLDRYTMVQLLMKVRTEKRAFDLRNDN